MDIDKIIREAVEEIKSRWTLPKVGFLAGGSIANIAWEKVSSKKAVVNDLDIFTYVGKIPNVNNIEYEKFTVKTLEKEIYEDYKGLSVSYRNKPVYIIDSCFREGIYNTINYLCDVTNPEIILDSFDLNCCEVGYLIEEDKIFYTKNFKKFLETGKLQLSNLATPAHSAIRLIKKSQELDVEVPEFELDILTYVLDGNFTFDLARKRFKEKYANLFRKYESSLSDRFELVVEDLTVDWLRAFNISNDVIYSLKPKENKLKNTLLNRSRFTSASEDFLVWLRQVRNNDKLENLWLNLFYFYDRNMDFEEYCDVEISNEKMEFMGRLARYAPLAIKNIFGFKLSRQIEIIDKVFEKFKGKPVTAISVLESIRITNDLDLDNELNIMIWEISLREKVKKNEEKQKDLKILENKNVDDDGENVIGLPF